MIIILYDNWFIRCGLSQCSIFWSICINQILQCSDGICNDELCELISDYSDKCNIQLVLHNILFNETILHDRISQYQQGNEYSIYMNNNYY